MKPLVRALDLDVLSRQPPEELPGLATQALTEGLDGATLRELAGANPRGQPQDIRDLFRTAMSELGVEMPTATDARWRLVEGWAQEMLDGTRSPYEASRLIWWEGWEALGRPDNLTVFVGLASEWEDDPSERASYEAQMRKAARELLAAL